ncbi:(4Fe-4S)-binding protein [Halobacteriales archaeon QS_3_64_16]|nr:MAG: (4Fe-4S)-binding protein [Halobacteriales archaeon QS_3_64_16]
MASEGPRDSSKHPNYSNPAVEETDPEGEPGAAAEAGPADGARSRREKAAALRHLMATEGETVGKNTRGFNESTEEAISHISNYEDLRDRTRAIKKEAIAELPDLIDRVTEAVEANGGSVYVAEDAVDANSHIASLMNEHSAEKMVKSKSMTTEELELNAALEKEDFDVVETDLGEWVIQIAEEAPSHLIGPAIHKSPEEIATLFNEHFEPAEPFTGDPNELTRFARDKVGEHIQDADIGLTGANFVMAESGSIALVTNEGNARKTAITPPTHVAVTGVEKLLPSVRELAPFVELIGRTGTGQDITSYVSLLTPPTDSPVLDFEAPDEPMAEGDRDFHLVLVDNGRLAMREDDQLRETLYCIRCGACNNSCANFQSVGGHGFGGETYTGGIGTGWEAGIEGLDSAGEFNDLCTGCSRCVNKCPVKIDIPWINTVVRDRVNRGGEESDYSFLVEGLTPDSEPRGIDVQKRLFGNIESLAKLGSVTAPLSNWLTGTRPARALLDRALGVDARRELPQWRRETFRDWASGRESISEAEREVVLYPDLYTNYVLPERGKAAVRVLEALGVGVTVPEVGESGRAPLSQGMIATADRKASAVYANLAEHVDAGRDVVVIEPSDLAMFRNDYEKLLPEKSFERLRDSSYEVMEYVYGLLENGADREALPKANGTGKLAYHSHCQQRTLGLEPYTTTILSDLGYDVTTSDVECCGMAGSFGYKSEYYEVSMDVGRQLKDQFEAERADGRTLVASGTSCGDQLEALFGDAPPHPIELLDPR